MDLTVINVCLIIITSLLFIRSVIWGFTFLSMYRHMKRELSPLLSKTDGILDNLSSISESARDQMDEVTTAVQDISYKTREVSSELEEKIIPVLSEFAGTLSGISKVIGLFFRRTK